MTKIKFCGLSREQDIQAANQLLPDYIGFVFAKNSKRYVSEVQAAKLKSLLSPAIKAVGVFVDEKVEVVADLLNRGVIDIAQLHGNEDGSYVDRLKSLTDKKILQAFKINAKQDVLRAKSSGCDFVLLDGGSGDGKTFDYSLIKDFDRPFFLAGGLTADNLQSALSLKPYAVDCSSGIETNGAKDPAKMADFIQTIRRFELKGE
ncbi:MAG: phosphoribosylanthranilate isomerase [Clostridia bacterium]|nr:phosphoribosylanthranilate isomerase [Clostridia bacterium]